MGRNKKGPANATKKGKSKKETWKKISHPDIDDYLEDAREDERLGGITKLPDSSLFMFDLNPDDSTFNSAILKEEKPPMAEKKSDKLVDVLELKCFSILKPDSKVKDPLIKRDRIRKPGEKKSLRIIENELKRRQKKEVKADVKPDLHKLKSQLQMRDLWRAEPSNSKALDTTWLRPTSIRENLKHRQRKNFHKTSEIKAIEPPHPGFSYNPSFTDHQDLLKLSTEIAAKKFVMEAKLDRATAIPKVIPYQHGEHFLVQPSIGDDEESEEEEGKEEIARKQKRSRTRQSKRHEHDAKTLELEIKAKKDLRRKEAEVYNIKNLQKEISNTEWVNKARLNEKVQKKILHERFGQKKLGRTKYEEPTLNPVLSEELEGSLIGITSSSSLLSDRFKSLQKRNIIEPRVKNTNKRKHKLKKYTRQSERMEWEKTGMWDDIKII